MDGYFHAQSSVITNYQKRLDATKVYCFKYAHSNKSLPFFSLLHYRSDHWWNFIVLKTFTPQDWVENFRMSRQTFDYLCQRLHPQLNKEYSHATINISAAASGNHPVVLGYTY